MHVPTLTQRLPEIHDDDDDKFMYSSMGMTTLIMNHMQRITSA